MSTLTAKRSLLTHLAPYLPVSDKFRSLRNMIENGQGSAAKAIAVTSAEPRAGKTTTAVNLAIAFAQGGRSVLLIDGHLNRPALHDIFSESNLVGLTSVLLSGVPLTEATKDVGIPQLSVLTAGPKPSRYFDSLESDRMSSLLAQARVSYDYIVLDAPAILDATDATTLAAKSDGVLWVVDAGRSRRPRELEAKRLAARMNLKVIGCVLNGARSSD